MRQRGEELGSEPQSFAVFYQFYPLRAYVHLLFSSIFNYWFTAHVYDGNLQAWFRGVVGPMGVCQEGL